MADTFKVRSFKVSWLCVADAEAYNGFNVALCGVGDNPVTNPIKVLYVKPAYNTNHTYEYTFKYQLVIVGTYEVWVQAVSYGKDSMWHSAGGLEIPDDGVGTISGTTDPTTVKQIVQDGLNNNTINIDASKTDITNINGGNVIYNTITVGALNVGSLVGDSAFLHTLVVDGVATITEAWIGGVHIKDNEIVADKIDVTSLAADTAKIKTLTVDGIATITEAWIGGVQIKDNAIVADKIDVTSLAANKAKIKTLTVDGIATINEAWIGGVQIKDNAVTADKVNTTNLGAKLATIEEAYIGGVHIVDDSITANNIAADSITSKNIAAGEITAKCLSADSVSAQNIISQSIETRHIKAEQIISTLIAADAVEAKNLKISAELSAKLATITEAYIGGVHIVNNSITAQKVNSYDLAMNGFANLNVAYVKEANLGTAVVGTANLKTASVDAINIKDGVIDIAKISDVLQSTNYSTNATGWQIKKDGTAEFCGGVKIANWIVSTNKLQSQSTGSRIELVADKNRVSILGSLGDTKLAMGYWEGLQKFDELGNLLSGQFWTSSDYGYYIAPGNSLKIKGAVEFSTGSCTVKSDGSYKILNSENNTIVKMGTESGETGLFCYDTFGNVLSALTNDRIEVGSIATGTGIKYDSNGLQIVGKIKITQPIDNSGISVPEPYNIGLVLI